MLKLGPIIEIPNLIERCNRTKHSFSPSASGAQCRKNERKGAKTQRLADLVFHHYLAKGKKDPTVPKAIFCNSRGPSFNGIDR